MLVPPLGLAYIAGAVLAQGYPCEVIDAVGEGLEQVRPLGPGRAAYGLSPEQVLARIPADTELIGVACAFTKEWPAVRELLGAVKARFPQALLVCGGEHATAVPEESMRDCPAIDVCVLGEGEAVFLALLKAWETGASFQTVNGIVYRSAGELVRTPRAGRIQAVDELAWPGWTAFPLENYFAAHKSFGVARGRSMPLLATRGCPYGCSFCSSELMWERRWVPRSPDRVVEEMRAYHQRYAATNFDFYDLTAGVRKAWLLQLAEQIRALGLGITWQLPSGTRSEVFDDELCQALYAAHCRNLSFSPENAAPAVLQLMRKQVDPKKVLAAVGAALRAGINVKINLVFGFPGERHRDSWTNLAYILRLSWMGAHDLSIWSFAPYPGSAIFAQLKAEGRIKGFETEYLDSLTYGDMHQRISWNPRMTVGWINAYRWLGVLAFYCTTFLFRPQRMFKLLLSLITGKVESRAEHMTAEFFRSWKRRKAKARS